MFAWLLDRSLLRILIAWFPRVRGQIAPPHSWLLIFSNSEVTLIPWLVFDCLIQFHPGCKRFYTYPLLLSQTRPLELSKVEACDKASTIIINLPSSVVYTVQCLSVSWNWVVTYHCSQYNMPKCNMINACLLCNTYHFMITAHLEIVCTAQLRGTLLYFVSVCL